MTARMWSRRTGPGSGSWSDTTGTTLQPSWPSSTRSGRWTPGSPAASCPAEAAVQATQRRGSHQETPHGPDTHQPAVSHKDVGKPLIITMNAAFKTDQAGGPVATDPGSDRPV